MPIVTVSLDGSSQSVVVNTLSPPGPVSPPVISTSQQAPKRHLRIGKWLVFPIAAAMIVLTLGACGNSAIPRVVTGNHINRDRIAFTASSTYVVGQTLVTTNGVWTNNPTSFAYQWKDCDVSGSNCVSISKATSSSYTLAFQDIGHTVVVSVTATNAAGSTTQISAPTGVVASNTTGGCTTTVSSLSAINGALTSGSMVCLAAGSYGSLSVTAKPTSQATLTAAPGAHVVIAGIDVESSNITISQLHVTGQGLEFWQKSTNGALTNDVAEHNEVGPTTGYGISIFANPSTPSEHIRIAYNKVHDTSSTSEGDALRFDGWKNVEVIGNDIYKIKECSTDTCHTDTLQSYNSNIATSGLLIERNYIHDCTSAQGFPFLKDGNISNVVIRDNLSLRMSSNNQVTGIWVDEVSPGLTVENNTYQGTSGSQIQTESGSGSATVSHNVFDALNEKSYSLKEDYDIYTGNNEWSFTLGPHDVQNTKPGFINATIDDYRLATNPNHIGIDWSPAEVQYGPIS